MKKFLLLLCILSITISAKAQLFGKNWKEGSYYDLQGTKHAGLISWTPPQLSFLKGKGDNIYYKKDKKSDDIKIKSVDLMAFNMKVDEETIDSFIVSKNEKFEDAPFLNVVIAHDVKLYSWITAPPQAPGMGVGGMVMGVGRVTMGVGVSAGKTIYFFGSDPENVTKLDKKNFIETMSKIMADKPETVARIKNKKLRYGDMDDLLYFYRFGLMPPAQAPDPFSGKND